VTGFGLAVELGDGTRSSACGTTACQTRWLEPGLTQSAAFRRLAHQPSGTAEAMSTTPSPAEPRRHNTTPPRTMNNTVTTARRMY